MLFKEYCVLIFILIGCVSNGLSAGCSNNEVVSNCANNLCQYTNCSQLYQPIVCVDTSTELCTKGCICEENHLRADNGTCIPVTKCPNYGKCSKKNEYYDLCPSPCINRVCGVNKPSTNCAESSGTCLPPACICKVGFYRNYHGNCVVESLCAPSNNSLPTTVTETTQTSTSEMSSTTKIPTSSSATNTMPTTTYPTIISQFFNITTHKCHKNEIFEKNPCALCQPFTCSEVGFPLACLQSDYSRTCNLQPGCYCMNGYVRNNHNVCVAVNRCPSCGGDVNAESGCRVTCPTCSDYWNKTSTACSKLCKLNGCGCKRRYVYDEAQKKCVLLRNYCPKHGK